MRGDNDDPRDYTGSNFLGCTAGGLLFLLTFTMAAVAFGTGCQPDMPCWTDNRSDLLIAFLTALTVGVAGGFSMAKLFRWVSGHFRP